MSSVKPLEWIIIYYLNKSKQNMAARKSGGKLSMRDPLPRYIWFVTYFLGPEARFGSVSMTNSVVVNVDICITAVIHSALHYAIPFANEVMNAEGGETQNKRPVSTPFGWQRVLISHAWDSPSNLSNLAWCIQLLGEHSTCSTVLVDTGYGQWSRYGYGASELTISSRDGHLLYPKPDLWTFILS